MGKSDIYVMLKYLPQETTLAISPLGLQEEIEYKEVTLPTRDIITAFMKLKEMAIKEACKSDVH